MHTLSFDVNGMTCGGCTGLFTRDYVAGKRLVRWSWASRHTR